MPIRTHSERREYSEDGQVGQRQKGIRVCEKLFYANRSGVCRLGARAHPLLCRLRAAASEFVDARKPLLYLLPQHAYFERSVWRGAVLGPDSGNVRMVLALLTWTCSIREGSLPASVDDRPAACRPRDQDVLRMFSQEEAADPTERAAMPLAGR